MARIVIAGGGFAGIEAARVIARGLQLRRLKDKHSITIIDKNSYHTFTPALIPASTTPKTVPDEIVRSAVCIPLSDIRFSIPVEIVTDEIIQFNVAWNSIVGKKKHYEYDYLIIAVGQETTFFDTQGMKAHSFPLATIEDALMIRNELVRQIQNHDAENAQIRVIGGGPTGVEFAGLLKNRQHSIVQAVQGRCELEVSILDSGDSILRRCTKPIQTRVAQMLTGMNVSIITNAKINFVSEQFIEFENQEHIPFDMIFWGAGRTATKMVGLTPFLRERAGAISINDSGIPKIPGIATIGRPVYAAGDTAYISDKIAWVAPNAMVGGKNVGNHILANIDFAERLPNDFIAPRFKAKNDSIFLLGLHSGVITIPIFIPARMVVFIRRLVDLRYFLRIMSPLKAWERWRLMKVLYS
ncbi:MAG: FAD-dependent oxidoreductase [Candidatus Paceibacterota bacterium]